MFNIGPLELLVIAVLALVVLGPERLPDAARQVGKVMGDLRRLSSGFQQEVKSAFDDADRASTRVPPVAEPPAETVVDPGEPGASGEAPAAPAAPMAAVAAVSGQARGARTVPKSTPASRRADGATAKVPAKPAAKAAGTAKKKAVNGNPAKGAAPKKAATPTKKAAATKTSSTSSAAKSATTKAPAAKKAAGTPSSSR